MANVTAIYYSSSLSIQLWGKHFLAVPRFVWNTLLAAISLGLAWGGRDSLADIITDFLSLLGYWTICFGLILAIEHFWFRPRIGGYDLEGWQDQDRMPWGIAGCISLALGFGLSFVGMDQTWVRRGLVLAWIQPTNTIHHSVCRTSRQRRLVLRWRSRELHHFCSCRTQLPHSSTLGDQEIRTLKQ